MTPFENNVFTASTYEILSRSTLSLANLKTTQSEVILGLRLWKKTGKAAQYFPLLFQGAVEVSPALILSSISFKSREPGRALMKVFMTRESSHRQPRYRVCAATNPIWRREV